MLHRAVKLEMKEGTLLELTFQDGKVKQYDVSALFRKIPRLAALENRDVFLSGRLRGPHGMTWNGGLDLSAETVYEGGVTVRTEKTGAGAAAGLAVAAARARKGVSQKELAAAAGIDQSDLSKIERGAANPSVLTLSRIAEALNGRLNITITGAEGVER